MNIPINKTHNPSKYMFILSGDGTIGRSQALYEHYGLVTDVRPINVNRLILLPSVLTNFYEEQSDEGDKR